MPKQSTATALTEANHAAAIGKLLVESGMFTDVTAAAQAAVKVLAGKEVGIGPIQSMSGLHVIKGKVVMSATLMASLILRSGRYSYEVKEHDETVCMIEFFRDGKSIGVSQFSMDNARKAGLTGNPTWRTYPRNMLFARAISNGARWYCPDVFSGPVYTPEELDGCDGGSTEQDHNVVDAEFEVVSNSRLDEDLDHLTAMIEQTGTDQKRLFEYYGVNALSDLTADQRQHAMAELSSRSTHH